MNLIPAGIMPARAANVFGGIPSNVENGWVNLSYQGGGGKKEGGKLLLAAARTRFIVQAPWCAVGYRNGGDGVLTGPLVI